MVAIVRASPRNRSAKPGSSSRAGSRILTATVRPSTSSVPRQTSPMPPPAIRSSRRYRPPRVTPGLIMSVPFPAGRSPHDAPGDPGRLGTRVAAGHVLQHDADRGDRLAFAVVREPDEPSVGIRPLGVLRGTGLAADLEAVDLRAPAGALLDDTDHHLPQLTGDLAVDRGTQHLQVGVVDRAAVRAEQLLHQ